MQAVTRRFDAWLPDKTMPQHVLDKLQPKKFFTDVHKKFVAMAAPRAQAGTDYDIPNEPPCFDQENEGSCVLNSTTGAASILLGVEQGTIINLSRNFAYWQCREVMGTLTQDSGTFVHLAVSLLGQVGAPRESTWPYDNGQGSTMFTAPTPDCYPEASDNQIKAWFNIDDGLDTSTKLDQMEAAIRANHPVPFGTLVDQTIMSYVAGQVLTIPVTQILGGHSMCATGLRYINGKRNWRIRNSWGVGYGDNGHLLIDDAYMGWVQTSDRWVLTRMDPVLF